MKQILLITSLILSCTIAITAGSEPYYYSVKAKSGDGVYSLLRRFKLDTGECNMEKFYEINELDEDAILHADREYKLPIFIYDYDGKSIRSTIGISDWDVAVNIKEYNQYLKDKKLRRTDYTSSKILWVPHSVINCKESIHMKTDISAAEKSVKSEDLSTPTGATRFVKLFGDKHANVEILDNELHNQVFYLVSGHGGPDPGAQCTECPSTLCEDEYAYDVVLRLARNLMQHGAIVHVIIKDHNDGIRDEEILSCDYDEVCLDNLTIPRKQVPRLVQRAVAINNLYRSYKKKGVKKQTSLVIHVDSRENVHQRVDTYFMYAKNSKSGKKLAEKMRDTFEKKYEFYQKDRGYKGSVTQRNWFMLNNTLTPTVYIELGNIKNKKDQRRLTLMENRQALANWMFEGLTDIKS